MTDFVESRSANPAVPTPRPVHPLIHAGKWLASDMFSTLIFVGLYALTHSLIATTILAIAAGVGQIAYLKSRGRPVDAMQWMSLGLVIVFGGAAFLTQDPRFIMLKPTLIYCAIGTVMLRRGWMNRYMPPRALEWSSDVLTVFGYAWAAMMFGTAALNLYLAILGDPVLWAWVLGIFPIASKFGLIMIQYGVTRAVTIARIRAAGAYPVRDVAVESGERAVSY